LKNNNEALVIGPFGFGKVHIREYLNRKFKKVYLLSKKSNKFPLKIKSLNLKLSDRKKVSILKKDNLRILKKNTLVSICSPNNTHLKYLNNKNIKNKKVLCEKPIIWDKKYSVKRLKDKTNEILKEGNGRILFNDFSRYYTQQIKKKIKIGKLEQIKIYYQVSSKNEKDLSVDLLIHAIAMIQELINIDGNLEIINFKKQKEKHYYKFYLNKTVIVFEFINKTMNKSKLKITLNRKLFVRKHKYFNEDVKVSFIHNKKEIKINNPIKIGFNKFLLKKKSSLNLLDKQLKISNLFFKLISI
tara:strand:+ start:1270 stop:2169 length:900 start_codon:yes stop_codon:yes gene_type:complete